MRVRQSTLHCTVYFAYEPDHIYGFTTVGRKIEWMRANPKLWVEVDEVISYFQWMSVIVTGRYQELPNSPALNFERQHALTALGKRMLWWQTAITAKQLPTGHEVPEPLFYLFYRIHIESVTGLRAFPDAVEARTSLANQTGTL